LRDVAGPNRPSAEVIESAFGDADARKESSLPSFELLVGAPEHVVLPEGSTGGEVALPTPGMPAVEPNALETEDDVAETAFDAVPANAEASRAIRYEADPSWNRGKHGESLKELQRKAQEQRENPAGYRRKQMIPYAIGGAVVLILIVIVVKACAGSDEKNVEPVAKPADPIAVDAAVASTADAAIVVDAQVAVAPDAADQEIEMPVDEVPDRPKPTKSAEQYYADGLAAWKKQDAKAAYDAFTNGRRANSKYANNWYGLGLVHEKAGRKSDARTAYERYLKLAPNAPNGGKLRDHIKKNLM
jgi:tetratricopeptide (TPR) repeat protein